MFGTAQLTEWITLTAGRYLKNHQTWPAWLPGGKQSGSRGHTQPHTTQSSSILFTSTVTSTVTTVLGSARLSLSSYGCYAAIGPSGLIHLRKVKHTVSISVKAIWFVFIFNSLLLMLPKERNAETLYPTLSFSIWADSNGRENLHSTAWTTADIVKCAVTRCFSWTTYTVFPCPGAPLPSSRCQTLLPLFHTTAFYSLTHSYFHSSVSSCFCLSTLNYSLPFNSLLCVSLLFWSPVLGDCNSHTHTSMHILTLACT